MAVVAEVVAAQPVTKMIPTLVINLERVAAHMVAEVADMVMLPVAPVTPVAAGQYVLFGLELHAASQVPIPKHN